MGIHTEYKAFKNGIVSVEVKAPDNSENMLFLHVGLTELDVACTCGMPDGKLCYHGYIGLHSLAWSHYLELDRFYWPGLTADENVKDKFLTTEVTKNWIAVKPKTKYGNIFKATIGFWGDKPPEIEKSAKIESTVTGGQQAIAYCLAYNVGNHSNLHLPVLIPCLGLASKNNQQIVSFKQFGRADKPIRNITYTANQELLNDIGFRQYGIAKVCDGLTEEEKKIELPKLKQDLLGLWEQVTPLLLNEKYVYGYYTYWLRYLKGKPRKADIRDCKFSLERPILTFNLKFHQDHFSLTAVASVNGNTLKFNHKPHLFVFDETTELCYLMPTVQDDDLLMWMLSYNNRLTILKEHFAEFQTTFLDKLSSCYTISFTDTQTKKAIPYNFETVYNELVR
jgi:hypothetical protein